MKTPALPFAVATLATVTLLPWLPLSVRAADATPDTLKPAGAGSPAFAPGELVVQFSPAVTDTQIRDAFAAAQLNFLRQVSTPAMHEHGQIGLTHVATSLPVLQAAQLLSRMNGIDFAEPNWIYSIDAESNDTFYSNGLLWGMYGDDLPLPVGPAGTSNPFGSQAEKAWAAGFTGSPDVFVGIVDQGIQFTHPDLASNIWTNPGEIPDNGIDDDGNGYIDDVHGWNAVNDNGNIYDPTSTDSHGTHVAGTVGAVGGNGIGVAGINWNASIISGKFGEASGGSLVNAVEAIDYLTMLKTKKGLNVVALNNSWGGTSFSQALLDSITRAAQAGILFTAAAGNSTNNNDLTPFYPASYNTTVSAGYDSVISVAAIEQHGDLTGFSNYGATSVDLAAPGDAVYSTVPTDSYGVKGGTSMASPHVTGALALYASTHPQARPLEIKNALLTSGVAPTSSLAGKTVTGGRLDLSNIISDGTGILPPVPNAPAGTTATAVYTTRIQITWLDQATDELGFAIERSVDGQIFGLLDTTGANITQYVDKTAQAGASYYYRLRAYNTGGSSEYSPVTSVNTTGAPVLSAPAAPSGLSGSSARNTGTIVLTWRDNSSNEDAFQIERKSAKNAVWASIGRVLWNTTTYSDTSLPSLTTYYYRVKAYNSAGSSVYSAEVSIRTK